VQHELMLRFAYRALGLQWEKEEDMSMTTEPALADKSSTAVGWWCTTSITVLRASICTRLGHVLRYARQSRARHESYEETSSL